MTGRADHQRVRDAGSRLLRWARPASLRASLAIAAALAYPGLADAAPRGQGCSSPQSPSLSAVDTCAPFALPDGQLPRIRDDRPPAVPKPLFLPPVVDTAKPPPSAATRNLPILKAGMLYASVRGILIGQGFSPAPSGREDRDRCGAEFDICHDFPEVHACTGASTIVCEFVFERPPGEALVVTTTGNNSLELVTRAIQRASVSDLARHKVGR